VKQHRFGEGILGNRKQVGHFLAHVENLTERVQRCINEGPITSARHADVERIVHVLNHALARKLACVLRYKRHFSSAEVMNAPSAAEEFLQRATEQSAHTDMIAERIRQLGGLPDFRLATSGARKGADFGEVSELDALIREDLEAQRIAIASYVEIIRWLGDDDPTTRRVFEQILAMEKEHAEDMLDLLVGVNY
jgi:bacterioferritin